MVNNRKYMAVLAGFALSQVCLCIKAEEYAEKDKTTIDDVIVITAQKREQSFFEVPMAVAAIGGEELKQRSINSVQDLSFAIPGLTTREDGPGSYQIFMRGVANTDGGRALVSVYQDEAPLALTGFDILPTKVFDLNRLEVLKGPQGTLYGQGAVTGTIRYITNQPDLLESTGNVNLEVRSVSEGDTGYVLDGMFNLPIIENELAIRLVGAVSDGGGWQDQPDAGIEDGNDEELEYLRARALWVPNEDLEITFSFDSYYTEHQLGLGYEQPDRTIYNGSDDPTKVLIPKVWDYLIYGLNITYAFDQFDFLSATHYIDLELDYPFSYFGSEQTIYNGQLFGNDSRFVAGQQLTQEFRLTSNSDSPLVWTVGTFYRDLERDIFVEYESFFEGKHNPDLVHYDIATFKSYSIFADTSYQLTDKLLFGVGLRYFEEDQSLQEGLGDDKLPLQKDQFDSIDPRIYLSYELSEQANLYVNIGKGFRSGGFNGFSEGIANDNFSPESLWSYELGLKGAAENLIYEVAAFYTDYEKMLRRGLVFSDQTGQFQTIISNIGKSEIKGLEGSIVWKATEALSIDVSASLLNTEVVEVNSTDATNKVGDEIDYSPKFSYTLGLLYDFDWSADMPGYFRANYSYRDKVSYTDRRQFPEENIPQLSDDISLLDVRLGLIYGDIDVAVYATNLTDENKLIDPYSGWFNANRTRPRTIGFTLGYQF